MSRYRTAGLIACGTALVALTFLGLLFQLEDRLDRFLIVAGLQSAIHAFAVWLAWKGGLARGTIAGILALAIVMRVPVALAPPYLSADVYRYVWDGRVETAGFNPYRHAPADAELGRSFAGSNHLPADRQPARADDLPTAGRGGVLCRQPGERNGNGDESRDGDLRSNRRGPPRPSAHD